MSLARVLVVDDDPDIVMILEMILLENCEMSVKTADNGQMTLEICNQWKPEMILMDVKMPVLDGFSTLARIKEDKSLSHIPVIMVTANSLEESQGDCLQQGAQAVIAKPFDPLTLHESILRQWEGFCDSSKRVQ